MSVPSCRIRLLADAPPRPDGDYVLYWMTAYRRTRWNFALDRAVERAAELKRPLLILEALRCGYRWASDRMHAFVLQGMPSQAADCRRAEVGYYPYVEAEEGEGSGLLERLAGKACLVVTDDFPCFFLPRMLDAAAKRLSAAGVRLEAVDGNGLLPMRLADRTFPTAFAFRRFLQRELPAHLGDRPRPIPLRKGKLPPFGDLDRDVLRRWPAADPDTAAAPDSLARLPIDHDVAVSEIEGGAAAAAARLEQFVQQGLDAYGEDRNHPDEDGTSGFSPYLHFGHLSAHEVFAAVADREEWTPDLLSDSRAGKRTGWWGMSESAESFLDELVTWREVGFNMCVREKDYDRYASLPDWARRTLAEHEADARKDLYTLEQFETSATHDPLWNAAQRQLVVEGRMHNYLRMLWGKKILEWSPDARSALRTMIELNNKYALDGRNPNSYSGIFWVLGRYDRAWGPERPIFGKIRYMSSDNTARKLRVKEYLSRWSPSLFS